MVRKTKEGMPYIGNNQPNNRIMERTRILMDGRTAPCHNTSFFTKRGIKKRQLVEVMVSWLELYRLKATFLFGCYGKT